MIDGPTLLGNSAASELRQALRGPDWCTRPQEAVDFMLSSARASTLRFNTGGWVARGVCLLGVAMALGMLHAPGVWWCLASVAGWVLAGLELFGSDLLDAVSRRPGPIGRIAVHLVGSRTIALPTLSGVLENAGSALLLWAASSSTAGRLHDVAVVGTLTYVAVAASQVMTDAGYYNREPGQESARWIVVFRWSMAPLYCVVGLLALAWLNPALSGWLVAVTVTVFAGVIVIGAVSDSHQTAATTAHLVASEQQARGLVALLSEEVHRVSTSLAEMAHSASDPATMKALQVGFAEVDAIRFQTSQGFLGRTPRLGDVLTLIDRKSGSQRAAVSTNAPEMVLSDGGNTILRHLIIDLVTNARTAGGTDARVHVEVRRVVSPFVYLHVTVRNASTAPTSSAELNEYVPGSSRAALMDILSRKRGSLRYEVTGHTIVAHAEYRTELGVVRQEESG